MGGPARGWPSGVLMQNDMSASATSNIPASGRSTFPTQPTSVLAGPGQPVIDNGPDAPLPSEAAVAATAAAATSQAPAYQGRELVIQPTKGWIGIDWSELFRFRELLYFLVWRDVKVRYKQAVLGVGWAVLEPTLNMIVFTAIFGVAAGLRSNLPPDMPYAVFVFAGLVPWKLFATAMSQGGMSLVNQQNLLTKIYFPRLFVPTATVGSALVDMALQFVVFAGILAYYGFVPSWQIVFLPFLIALTAVMATGVAYLLSALTVTYRDFRFLIPVMVQVWMYLSFIPIPVPPSLRNSEKWQTLLAFNPMYGIVSAFRACITGNPSAVGFHPWHLALSVAIAAGVFVLGLFYFRKTERRFADIA